MDPLSTKWIPKTDTWLSLTLNVLFFLFQTLYTPYFSVGFSSVCIVRKSEKKNEKKKKKKRKRKNTHHFRQPFWIFRHFGFLFENENVSNQFFINIYTFVANCIFLVQIEIKLWADSRNSYFRLYFSTVYPKYKHFATADF